MNVLDVEILCLCFKDHGERRSRAFEVITGILVPAGHTFLFIVDIIGRFLREEGGLDLGPDIGEGEGFGFGTLKVVKDGAQKEEDERGPEEVLVLPLHHHPDDPDDAEQEQDKNDILEERNLHLSLLSPCGHYSKKRMIDQGLSFLPFPLSKG